MPELRRDPITGRWVIIATDRQKRPTDFRVERTTLIGGEHCPFCPGHESFTPPEILAYRQNVTLREHALGDFRPRASLEQLHHRNR